MNELELLKSLDKNKPFFEHEHSVLSAPVRHLFMIGVIWFLKQSKDPLNVLEIGSWFGASTLSFAEGMMKYSAQSSCITCVDAWKPFFNMDLHANQKYAMEMEKLLKSDFAYNIFLHNIGTLEGKINAKHIRGQSEEILPSLKNEYYDVVFIDADHTYGPVKKDITESLRLVKDGGIICGDDLNLQFHEVDKNNAEKNKNKDFIKDPKTNKNFHPGVTLAVFEIFGEVSSWGGFWAMQKNEGSWAKFSLKNMDVIYPSHFTKEHLEKAQNHFNDIKDSLY